MWLEIQRTSKKECKSTQAQDLLKKEEAFHDNWANIIDIDEVKVDECFEACTAAENKIILKRLGDIEGKKILDLGCGAGEAAVYFAKKGAEVTAVDISRGMLDVVQKVATKHGVYVNTNKASSYETGFRENTFDIVYTANLLHHVDIERTLSEINRVLREGGVFVSWDPLAYNPIINIYRKIAKTLRTQDEHPIKMKDLQIFRKYFSRIEINTTWFFTLLIFIKYFFFDRIDPNKVRYWKKVITEHKRLEKLYCRLEKIDYKFLKIFPFMKRYCWNIVIFAFK